MKRNRIDSRIEVWDADYINNPRIRTRDDRNAQIKQIEVAYGNNFIVEVFNKEEEDETD